MSQRRLKPEEIVSKLREADVLIAEGWTVAQACKHIGVTGFTYYRWRKEYGGMKTDQAKRLLAEAGIDKAILREGAGRGDPGAAPRCRCSSR
ncbi:MAG: transposase [Phycisphaerae bacterium]|nr:transposase [Phycisphaerae bacterium]